MPTTAILRRIALGACVLAAPIACTISTPDIEHRTRAETAIWRATFFQPYEFASKGNGEVRVQPRMVAALDATRAAIGRPIRIISGYRDPIHNARVGGAKNSRHLAGDAVDIDLSHYNHHSRYVLVWRLIENGFTSFGTYRNHPNLLHADMRAKAAIWRHGGGGQPNWLSKALTEWRWRPVHGSAFR